MYESVFHFRERPFAWAPRMDLYFPAASIESAYQTLSRCIERAEGPGMLVGGAGTGKSLLCQKLAERFHETFHVALLNSAQLCTRRAMLQNILFELGLPYRSLEEGELRLSLIDFLEPGRTPRAGLLLLVDEAHTLPLRLVEELRMITNLVRDGQPRVRLVLAGSPILEERLANPKLECFNQRIASRCYLHALSYEETLQYVRSQIVAVGGNPDRLFAPDALPAVHQATDGIPRLINQVCDHALILAAAGQRTQLDAAGVQEAWADLQQLPTPWQATVREAAAEESAIEFGTLTHYPSPDAADPESAAHPAADRELTDLAAQLDNVQLKVAAIEAATDEPLPSGDHESVEPAGVVATVRLATTETSWPQILNPFSDDFESEEVVVDRYASLEAAAQILGPAASHDEGHELADVSLVNDPLPEPEPGAIRVDAPAEAGVPHVAGGGPSTIFKPGAKTEESSASVAVLDLDEPPGKAKVVHSLPPDDSDLIVIVDDAQGATQLISSVGKPHRQEYRQLFSRLRQS